MTIGIGHYLTFAAILFTTPIYVYWGRAILIETAALFFVLLAVKYFLDYLLDAKTTPRLLLFSFFMSGFSFTHHTHLYPVHLFHAFPP